MNVHVSFATQNSPVGTEFASPHLQIVTQISFSVHTNAQAWPAVGVKMLEHLKQVEQGVSGRIQATETQILFNMSSSI